MTLDKCGRPGCNGPLLCSYPDCEGMHPNACGADPEYADGWICGQHTRYFIADTRHGVGDNVLWWRPNGGGYTTSLDDAGVYLDRDLGMLRDTDVPVPCALADEMARREVPIERLRQSEPFKRQRLR